MVQRHITIHAARGSRWDVCHATKSCTIEGFHVDERLLQDFSQKLNIPMNDLTRSDVYKLVTRYPDLFPTFRNLKSMDSLPLLAYMQFELQRLAHEVRITESNGALESVVQQKRKEYQEKLVSVTSHLERIYSREGEVGLNKIAEHNPGLKRFCHDVIDSHLRAVHLYEGTSPRIITQATFDAWVGSGLETLYGYNEEAKGTVSSLNSASAYHAITANRRRVHRDVLSSMRIVADTQGASDLRMLVQETEDSSHRTLALYASETALRSKAHYEPQTAIHNESEADQLALQINATLDIVINGESPNKTSTTVAGLMRAPLTKKTALTMYKDAIIEYGALKTSPFPEATDRIFPSLRLEAEIAHRAVTPDSVPPESLLAYSITPDVALLLQDIKLHKKEESTYDSSSTFAEVLAKERDIEKTTETVAQDIRFLAVATHKEDFPTLMRFLWQEAPDFVRSSYLGV